MSAVDNGKLPRGLAAAGAAALAARGAYAALRRWPPAGEKTWARTNHRGEPVTLLEGPAVAAGAVAAQVVTAAVTTRLTARPRHRDRRTERFRVPPSPRTRALRPSADAVRVTTPAFGLRYGEDGGSLAVVVAGLGALGFGVLDDLRGSGRRRGLRGHLGALAHGEVTTGSVKLAGLAATGLAAAALSRHAPGAGHAPGRAADVLIDAGLIAGGANLLNLFDLRPGRAIKVAAFSAGLVAAGGALAGEPETGRHGTGRLAGLAAVAAPAGAALALLPEDLGERAMLGDAGANALGAMLGVAAARSLPRPARLWLLTGIVALTVASEKVSFTRVIERTPPLRWLDLLGRRPVTQKAVPQDTVPQNTVPRERPRPEP